MSTDQKLYLGTNTKMFKTAAEAEAHILRLRELTKALDPRELRLFVIPSYTSLHKAVHAAAGSPIQIGAQNIGWEERGQFTGEISPLMLREAGVDLVMIGHSERRHVLRETDFDEEKKVRCAVDHQFQTLLCVGETGEEKAYGISREVLATQLKIGLHGLTAKEAAERLWIAYEPVWAIGVNGVPADEGYAEAMHSAIKETLAHMFGEEIGARIPVLYGGSVNKGNAEKLIVQPHIDGLFIGRSAWDADQFYDIIQMVLPLYRKKAGKKG